MQRPPPIASLLQFRVNPVKLFSHIGLDFANPLFFKTSEQMKVYILLFTSAVTRAGHLQLLKDQGVITLIRTLVKFSPRRSLPDRIQSDKTNTFKVTAQCLKEFQRHQEVQLFLQGKTTNGSSVYP